MLWNLTCISPYQGVQPCKLALFTIQAFAVSDVNNGLSLSSSAKLTYGIVQIVVYSVLAVPLKWKKKKKFKKWKKKLLSKFCKLLEQIFVLIYFGKITQNANISSTNPGKVSSTIILC